MTEDIGTTAIRQLHELWQVDEDRCEWVENGFDWCAGDFKQSIRISEPEERDGLSGYRLFAITDYMKDVSRDRNAGGVGLDLLARVAPSYAVRILPHDLIRDGVSGEEGRIQLVSIAYVNEENVGWLPHFFSGMAILQPVNAQIQAAGLAETIGGVPDMSLPSRWEERKAYDQILEIVSQLYAPEGQQPSKWASSAEFEQIAEQFGQSDICFGSGDSSGLTLETPLGSDSFLIRLFTDQEHPQLGSGLLATLQVPFLTRRDEAQKQAAIFNFHESVSFTFFPLLGSWQTHETREDVIGPAFSSFIPNALYRPGLATNVALWMLGRARWVKDQFWPEVEDQTMAEIIENRLSQLKS